MSQQVYNLLRVLRDFTPELQAYTIEELYEYWKLWMEQGHKGTLKDFIFGKKVNDRQ